MCALYPLLLYLFIVYMRLVVFFCFLLLFFFFFVVALQTAPNPKPQNINLMLKINSFIDTYGRRCVEEISWFFFFFGILYRIGSFFLLSIFCYSLVYFDSIISRNSLNAHTVRAYQFDSKWWQPKKWPEFKWIRRRIQRSK